MSNAPKAWPNQSYLDALRPPPGERVRFALLATYSADLWSLGATLLALAGRDLDNGSGTRADMAEAIEALRGRIGVVVQRGRLAKPRRTPKIAAVFDQFVTEVACDESISSWHPKIALIGYEQADKPTSWRLWIGSKNLTRAWNLDFGLVLNAGTGDRRACDIEGVADLGYHLATLAGIPGVAPNAIAEQLKGLKWIMPPGVKVKRITLKRDHETLVQLPDVARADEIFVVSPFLDGTFIKRIGTWGDEHSARILVSTEMAARKLASQAGFPLEKFGRFVYVYDQPEPDASVPQPADILDATAMGTLQEDEVVPFGLHAKVIALVTGRNAKLWVGSANATQRGWGNGNVEVIAEIDCEVSMLDGLRHLVGLARPVEIAALRIAPIEPDHVAERLEECRRQLAAALDALLLRNGDVFTLVAAEAPSLSGVEMELRVGLATTETVPWPAGQRIVLIGSVPAAEQTGLVRFQLALAGQVCEWLQKFVIEPAVPPGRDRAAIAAHLGPQQFLAWVRAMLNGNSADPDEPNWDDEDKDDDGEDLGGYDEVRLQPARWKVRAFPQITLEEILSCWARDPEAFAAAYARVDAYTDAVLRVAGQAEAEREHLDELRRVWSLAHASLGLR
ncbi:phospholipase D family protein [Cupriavidus sp. amp6]|uniref:phospholipase D family protein n=1 Tax=Cupriavidus sp. amp6 TaxID=388051 RepID=UPI00040B7843|nr:phospholipase D family protein [Cupriavidus sp. amp6]